MERLRGELPVMSPGADVEPHVKARVTELLEGVRLNPREWGQFAVYRKGRYTRTIVGYAPGQFIALMLCWGPGQQSPIHDHAGAHCFMKMLRGELAEERFDWSASGCVEPGPPKQVTELDAASLGNSVHFMHDRLGLHRVRNPSLEEPAVSLHIYAPPFVQCRVFPPTGAAPKVASMVSAMQAVSAKAAHYKAPGLSLEELCTNISQAPESDPFSVLDMVDAVELSAIDRALCCSAAHFSEFDVVRHLVHLDDRFSVVVSCWGPGQSTRPHTLGRGRKLWLKVATGNLVYEQFGQGDLPWETCVESRSLLAEGSVSLLTECAIRRHCVKNECSSEPAVTVEVFSPPLTQFTFHTSQGIVRKDIQRLVAWSPATVASAEFPTSTRARRMMTVKGRQYLSIRDFDDIVAEELSTTEPSQQAITTLLRKTVFNQEEWRAHAGRASIQHRNGGSLNTPRRILLAQRATHTIMLNVWGSNHECAGAGEHQGSRHWTLVLEGELQEVVYGNTGEMSRVSTLKEDSITFIDGTGVVNRSCDDDSMCISLHLYTPPLIGQA